MGFKYQIYDQSKAYYLTLTIVRWIDVFTRQAYKDIIIDSLKYCQKNKRLNVYAYVIMSNHMHMAVSAEDNNLSDVIRDFKQFTSKHILKAIEENETESRKEWMLNMFEFEAKKHVRNEKYQFWTHDNHAEELYSNEFIKQKVDYIHNNPVRAGIVNYPEEYKYSSASNYAEKESLLDVVLVSI